MNDFDFIDRKYSSEIGEQIAKTIGIQNNYINKNNHITEDKTYTSKSDQTKYLYEIEKYELEKELNESDLSIIKDLNDERSNYVSRLKYSLEGNSAEIDLCYENITWTKELWDGKDIKKYSVEDVGTNFSVYDVYLKIEKTDGEFTKKDIINLLDFYFVLEIGGQKIFSRDFITMCFFELLDNQEIFIEPNIIYLKAHTFENFKYGLYLRSFGYHLLKPLVAGLKKDKHYNYKITTIISGKNFEGVDVDYIIKYGYEHVVFFTGEVGFYAVKPLKSNDKHKIHLVHPTSILLYIVFNTNDDNDDDFSNVDLDYIGIILNGNPIWWEQQEVIKVKLLGVQIFVVCIDPQYRNYNKFCSLIKYDFDPKILRSINFSRMDTIHTVLEFESSNKKYYMFMKSLHINILRYLGGMIGKAFAD